MAYTPLSQIPPARLPKGFTDPRGFEVRTGADGARVGTVADLLVDSDGQAHQFAVDLGGSAGSSSSRRVLVPLDDTDVDAARKTAVLRGMTMNDVMRLPAYGAASAYGAAPGGAAPGGAAPVAEDAVRLTLAEEQLAIATRVQTGEVGIRKTVDTQRVRRTVPVAREEVTIERRPGAGLDPATAQVEVTDDEIRIPIFAEEVVIEKRVVPTAEYVVRKRRVTETRTVEADLRRERLAVEQQVEASDVTGSTAPNRTGSRTGV